MSFPSQVPTEFSQDSEDEQQRYPKRTRKTRCVERDGQQVLKLNQYTLNEGERSIFEQEQLSEASERNRIMKSTKQVSGFNLFVKSKGSRSLSEVAEEWRSIDQTPFKIAAEKQNEEEWEKSEKKAAERVAQLRAKRKESRKQEREAAEIAEARRKEFADEARKKSKPQQKSKPPSPLQLDIHNQAAKLVKFMTKYRSVFAHFLPSHILAQLPSTEGKTEGAYSIPEPVAQPACIQGEMRRYQRIGLAWLLSMYDSGAHPILGDEMGLGKTLQTISFIATLKLERKLPGQVLIVVPMGVMASWMAEFKKWCPGLSVMRFHATTEDERLRQRKLLSSGSHDCVLTTYETTKGPMMRSLKKRVWRALVLDEGHRIKGYDSELSQVLRGYRAVCRVILTGTVIQNNLDELWSLLSFLYPDYFSEVGPFTKAFDITLKEHTIDREGLSLVHYLCRPLALRRLKTEENSIPPKTETKIVFAFTEVQRDCYKALLLEQDSILKKKAPEEKFTSSERKKLLFLMMQLRKACSHPFLLPDIERKVRGGKFEEQCDDTIITSSGKMILLDKMLPKLKQQGNRVVVFSGFKRTLDIVEDYFKYRDIKFLRVDGSTDRLVRTVNLAEFNKPNSPYFVLLMTTRAGGLGINAQSADTVILLDSDWNPQVDLQAMARVHRIGQKKPVHVYRLIANGTVEERLLQRAQKKLFLDSMVNRNCTAQAMEMDDLSNEELWSMLSFGVDRVVEKPTSDQELERLICRGGEGLAQAAKLTAATFNEKEEARSLRNFEGTDFKKTDEVEAPPIMHGKRQTSSTTVSWGGDKVLKANLIEPNMVATDGFRTHGRQVAGRDYDHQDYCLTCWDAGELVLCDCCPAAYHLKCVGLRAVPGGIWSCPQHRCEVCQRTNTAAGNLLKCEVCPSSWCEDCVPQYVWDNITLTCQRYVLLGKHSGSDIYAICSPECKEFSMSEGYQQVLAACQRSSPWERMRVGDVRLRNHFLLGVQRGVWPGTLKELPGFEEKLAGLHEEVRDQLYEILYAEPLSTDQTRDERILQWGPVGEPTDRKAYLQDMGLRYLQILQGVSALQMNDLFALGALLGLTLLNKQSQAVYWEAKRPCYALKRVCQEAVALGLAWASPLMCVLPSSMERSGWLRGRRALLQDAPSKGKQTLGRTAPGFFDDLFTELMEEYTKKAKK